MVTVVARWKVKQGEASKALELAEQLARRSRQEEGCVSYDVYIQNQQSDQVLIFEIYNTMADFEFHKNTPHFKEFAIDQIIPLLEEKDLSVFE